MAQYLRSQTTGVVLPYNEKLRGRPNVELMTPDECAEYEASLKARANGTADVHPDVVVPTTTVEPTPEPVVEPEPVLDTSTVQVADMSEGEPTAEELLESLELD